MCENLVMKQGNYKVPPGCCCMRWVAVLLLVVLVLSWRARAWIVLLHHDELNWRKLRPLQQRDFGLEDWALKERIMVTKRLSVASSTMSSTEARQPGSRPPKCHNQCPGCEGECLARPMYVSGSHGVSQHAIWTCTCVF